MAKLIDETELIVNPNRGITKQIKTYQVGDEKFQIRYENSNGSPMGFNYKMCLAQYSKEKAQWNNLEDISVLKMSEKIPNYFSHNAVNHLKEFQLKMLQRLNKIYS